MGVGARDRGKRALPLITPMALMGEESRGLALRPDDLFVSANLWNLWTADWVFGVRLSVIGYERGGKGLLSRGFACSAGSSPLLARRGFTLQWRGGRAAMLAGPRGVC